MSYQVYSYIVPEQITFSLIKIISCDSDYIIVFNHI